MKLSAIPLTSMLLTATLSLANPVPYSWTDGSHKPIHISNQTATKNGWGHAGPKIPPKIKLLRSNPHRLTAIRFQDVDPMDAPDDEFLCSAVRRPRIVNELDSDDLSDHARARLLVARLRALKVYEETWG